MIHKGETVSVRLERGREHDWVTLRDGDVVPEKVKHRFEQPEEVVAEVPKEEPVGVLDEVPEEVEPESKSPDELAAMDKDELNDHASDLGLKKEITGKMRKKTIIKKILAHMRK